MDMSDVVRKTCNSSTESLSTTNDAVCDCGSDIRKNLVPAERFELSNTCF